MTHNAHPVYCFIRTASAFCEWCEHPKNTDAQELRVEAMRQISGLYAAALELPVCELPDTGHEADVIPSAFKNQIFKSFGALPVNYYREVFDPSLDNDDPPSIGDVADDLTDMYCDVLSGLSLFERGHETDALWHWRFTFDAHWGRHATSALHALHCCG